MGRPTKLTDAVEQKLLEAIKAGNYRRVAAHYAGVSIRTFQAWVERGKAAPGSRHGSFLQRVLEAEGQAEIEATGCIAKAAKEDWRAAAWYLERKHPERWARKDQVAVGLGAGGATAADGARPKGAFSLTLQVVREASPEAK